MRKTLLTLALLGIAFGLCGQGVKISQYPNTNRLGPNQLFIVTAGGTNMNVKKSDMPAAIDAVADSAGKSTNQFSYFNDVGVGQFYVFDSFGVPQLQLQFGAPDVMGFGLLVYDPQTALAEFWSFLTNGHPNRVMREKDFTNMVTGGLRRPLFNGAPVALSNDLTTALTINVTNNVTASNVWDRSNVKWWGAKGDGVTDDSAAFKSCGAFSNRFFAPEGRYVVTSLLFTNVTLTGERGSVLMRKASATTPMLTAYGTVKLDGLTLDGNRANQTGYYGRGMAVETLVVVPSTSDAAILDNCTLSNSTRAMIYTGGNLTARQCTFRDPATMDADNTNITAFIYGLPAGTGEALVSVSDSSFTCAVTNLANRFTNAAGIFLSEGIDGNLNKFDFVCERNQFYGVGVSYLGQYAGPIDTYNGVKSARIVGNFILGYSAGGIIVERTGTALVEGNTILDGFDSNDGNNYGISVEARARQGQSVFIGARRGENYHGVRVANNIVGGVSRWGIYAATADALVSGNLVTNVVMSSNGICAGILAGSPRVQVIGNTVKDCSLAHIDLYRNVSFSGDVTTGSVLVTNLTGAWTNLAVGDLLLGQAAWTITAARITNIVWADSALLVDTASDATQAGDVLASPIDGILVSGNTIGSDTTNSGHGINVNVLIHRARLANNTVAYRFRSANYGCNVRGWFNTIDGLSVDNAAWGVVLQPFAHWNQVRNLRAYNLTQYPVDVGASNQFTRVQGVYANNISGGGLVLLEASTTNTIVSECDPSFNGNHVVPLGDANYQLVQFTVKGVGIGTNSPQAALHVGNGGSALVDGSIKSDSIVSSITNRAGEVIATNAITLAGDRRTSWPAGAATNGNAVIESGTTTGTNAIYTNGFFGVLHADAQTNATTTITNLFAEQAFFTGFTVTNLTNVAYGSMGTMLVKTDLFVIGTASVNSLVATSAAFYGPALSYASSASNAPANNEFPTANWVRSLFNNGVILYVSTNQTVATNTDEAHIVVSFTNSIPGVSRRHYPAVNANDYIGSVVTSNTFMFLQGPILVHSYLESTNGTGGPSVTVHPEIYYSYDRTNWYGDYTANNQTIATGTNLYEWVVSFPAITSTNSTGFYIERRFKVGTATRATHPGIVVHIGTNNISGVNDASHISFSGPSSAAGNAYLANDQTFTGTNDFGATKLKIGGTNVTTLMGNYADTKQAGSAVLTNAANNPYTGWTNKLTITKYATNAAWNIDVPEKGNAVAITNTLGGSTANIWITNVVDGGWFTVRILADGTARTISITNASGLTLNVINTNGFSVLTLPQIPITASKLCVIVGQATVNLATTNIDLWCQVQQ